MKKEIIKVLESLDFSPSQCKVYAELLNGSKTVKELGFRLSMPRSTLVEALLFLESLDLVESTINAGGKSKIYKIKSINKLNSLIDNKISQFETSQIKLSELQNDFKKIVSFLDSSSLSFNTNIQMFLGKRELLNLYRSTLRVSNIYSICRLDDYYKLFPDGLTLQSQANQLKYIRKFRDLLIDGPSVERLVENQSKLDYSNYKYKVIKDSELSKESDFSDILITEGYTLFSNFKGETPYSFKLSSPEISKFLIYFHNIVWDSI